MCFVPTRSFARVPLRRAPRRGSSLRHCGSRENVGHREPAALDGTDDDRNLLAGGVVPAREVAARAGLRVNLNSAIDEVDDPSSGAAGWAPI